MDGRAIAQTLNAWRSGWNPDGLPRSGEPELSPALFRRMMKGEISATEAHRLNREELKGRRVFNDRIRTQLGMLPGGEIAADEVFELGEQRAKGDPAKVEAQDTALKEEITRAIGEERAARLFGSAEGGQPA